MPASTERQTVDFPPSLAAGGLFQAIGRFLAAQRLEPNPRNYALAYRILSEPAGPLAIAVEALTDGGVRLTGPALEALGERVDPGAGLLMPGPAAGADRLHERTCEQVSGFEAIVADIHAETHAFGCDLAESEDALRRSGEGTPGDALIVELTRITALMRRRLDIAESRLATARREASALRQQLADAQGDARRDMLTGLPNRRAFDEAAATPGTGPRHIAICDVDHFKSVNDRYGHAVGDRVLKAIGTTLARACADHLVTRHGGEEFVLLFDGIDADAACTLLEAARGAVGARRYRLRETDQQIEGITLSAGIVTLRPDEAVAQALRRADACLYAAKHAGRDRMVGEKCEGSAEFSWASP